MLTKSSPQAWLAGYVLMRHQNLFKNGRSSVSHGQGDSNKIRLHDESSIPGDDGGCC